MDKTKRYLSVAFVAVLAIVIVVSLIGMILLKKKPVILQGQIEATEIRISGKLPGRIDTFLVKEGQNVRQGDTLVVINSPEALAKYQQVNAMENIAKYQHQKVDEGTRKQIIASLQQLWNKSKSDLQLAKITYDRVNALYKDSVVTSQRKASSNTTKFMIGIPAPTNSPRFGKIAEICPDSGAVNRASCKRAATSSTVPCAAVTNERALSLSCICAPSTAI